jgi:hypothetical protein
MQAGLCNPPARIQGPHTGYSSAGPASTAVLDKATLMPKEPSTCTSRLHGKTRPEAMGRAGGVRWGGGVALGGSMGADGQCRCRAVDMQRCTVGLEHSREARPHMPAAAVGATMLPTNYQCEAAAEGVAT